MTARLVIAGVASGVGKTTVACALMAALVRRGLSVQPFKVGPDYIDPTHHTRSAGRPSRNLDSVMLPDWALRELFDRAASQAEVAVVEGVMGLFDGRNGTEGRGSTANVARLLGAPVVVVLDVARMSRSAGAIALGCVSFDPAVRVAGFILNRVGSETHRAEAAAAIEQRTGLPVLGSVPRDDRLAVAERHLGLVPAGEQSDSNQREEWLAAVGERCLDLDRLLACARETYPVAADPCAGRLFPERPVPRRAVLAVARDRAFDFYYQDSLDLLAAWGAQLVDFSPLEDGALPDGCGGVYLGGGFPEVFAADLAANTPMLSSVRTAAGAGMPIYAECGGLMYLGRTLTDLDGRRHNMTGVLPFDSLMAQRRTSLGYRSAVAVRDSVLMAAGSEVTGHEFHYSRLGERVAEKTAAYRFPDHANALEGYAAGSILASYLHLHFGSQPGLAERLVRRVGQAPTISAG